jgi:hypothetical protein
MKWFSVPPTCRKHGLFKNKYRIFTEYTVTIAESMAANGIAGEIIGMFDTES